VRDSLTGYAVSSEVAAQSKNGPAALSTNAEGRGSYQLASGRNDLEIRAVGYKNLLTHFEPDVQSVKDVTVWVDPLEPPNELRPEVVASKIRSGHALLHGHVFDGETGQPIKGAQVYLECAGVESLTNDRGYFLLYAPVPSINPTAELPSSDNLVVGSEGFKSYRRVNLTIAEGATHFIIDMGRGEGATETDDTHKLMLSPEQPKNTQTEIPEINDQKLPPESIGTREGVVQPLSLTVPTSIRVGSNCASKTTCTTFNVYSLDTYVKNGLDDEWISSWHAESLKAGAIAYRSYGVYYVYHPLTANYDICNTTSCQVNDPSDSSSRTNSATDNTTGIIVVDSSGNNPFFAEYAAENNGSTCADGFTGSPSANWSCLSDAVDAGQTFNGHGRGMCQWGTQRWAVNQGQDYVWIVNHYYNNNGSPSGARSAVLQTSSAPATVLFSSASYAINEGDPNGRVNITLTRSGDTTSSASVNFTTNDAAGLQNCNVINGIASPRCDYINTLGTMTFAAGETSKFFSVAIVDDSYAEGNESFTVNLSSPSGATLGAQSTATVTITDNEAVNGANPIDSTNFFVRQQYIDFLGREPDPPGFVGWTSTINDCAGDTTQCDRIHVSQLFFESAEFQQRGYFVYRFYPVAFGRKPDYSEFVTDLARVSGFLDATQLEAAKVQFIADFMARTAFVSTYNSLNNTQYVDALLNTAGVTLSSRQTMINGLNNSTMTRAAVLRQIVESAEVSAKYNHQAYAVMEYFGYLRRQPDAFYLAWIDVLDQSNDPRGMVTGFVNSTEYRNRFGP
jgi:hypothetical protein